MSFSKKSFLAGLLVGCFVAGGSAVFASQSVQAFIADVHFKFNGTEKALPNGYVAIGYNGHTYVPARFVADQLGASVGWDGTTNTVTIDTTPSGGSTDTSTSSDSVKILSVVSPVQRNSMETVVAQVPPGSTASIEVDYASGPSHAAGLEPQIADESGTVTWTFKVGGNTTLGDWPVTVTDNGMSDQASIEVVR